MAPSPKTWRLRFVLDDPACTESVCCRLRRHVHDQVVVTHVGCQFDLYAVSYRALREAAQLVARLGDYTLLAGQPRIALVENPGPSEQHRRSWAESDHVPKDSSRQHPRRRRKQHQRSAQRTVVSVVGKAIRRAFEDEMLAVADSLDLRCHVVRHPHLLTTQVAFELSGAEVDIRHFEEQLRRRSRATMSIDSGLIPFGPP